MTRITIGTFARLACVGVLAVNLSACFRPLYGPTASGESLGAVLAAIQVENVETPSGQERIGHYLRSELIFDLDGSGQPSTKRYKLSITTRESVQTPIVSSITGRAESATIFATAAYKLQVLDGSRTLTDGVAQGSATYDRSVQRFASVRAARDAEIRLAKLLSEQIKTRIASIVATQP